MPKTVADENSVGLIAAAGFLGAGAVIFLCGCILVWFSCLRETPNFWLNSGGYPVMLRDIVRVFYYPLLAFHFLSLLGITIAMCAKIKMPASFICFEFFVILGCWLLFAGSVIISAGNNLENFWHGRPLHYKPPLSLHQT